MLTPLKIHSVGCLVAVLCVSALHAEDWPQWRGPNRDGHAAGTVNSLPKDPKPAWKLPIGPGFSSPIVAGGKVIYLDEQEGKEVAHCLNAGTGKEIWRTPYAKSEGDEWGSGPRTTPFVDGDRVYFQSMNGGFRCLNLADGKPVWDFDFTHYGISFSTKTTEGTAARRGNNGSGVVDGDYVYVPVGAKGASIVCFDKLKGREIWKSGDDEAAYSSFVVATLAGTKQLVAFTADALTGLDLKTGATLWRAPLKTGAKRHAATPVIDGDTVTVNSQTIGLVRVKVSRNGNEFIAAQDWVNKPLTINLATPVLSDGHLYCYGPIRTKDYVCVEAANGTTKWTQTGFGIGKDQTDYASTIAVGKNLLLLTYDGQLVLIAANPEKFTELGRVQVCGKTWSYPAFADGKLYVRDGRDLQCLDLNDQPRGDALTAVAIDTPAGTFVARFSAHGLAQLGFPGGKRPAHARASATCPTHSNPCWIELTNNALLAILSGRHPAGLPPLDVSAGTGFQRRVWSALRKIPLGETRSYGEVAAAIHSPKATRAVGSACGANPIPVLIPCHRVLASGGRLGGFSGGLEWKKRLLMIEGVIIPDLPAPAGSPLAGG